MKRKTLPDAAPRRRLGDLTTDEYFDLVLPSTPGPGRAFASWAALVACYAAVRDELLKEQVGRPAPFGEQVLAFRNRRGDAALARATFADIADGEA